MKIAHRIAELAESATLAVSAKAAQLKAQGVDVVSFGAGEPDFGTPANIVEAAFKAVRAGHTRYPSPASGLIEAKRAVCAKLQQDNDLTYSPEQVLITPGGKMAIYMAMQTLLDPGDEVVIPVPYWVSFPEIVRLAGGVPVFVAGSEADDYKLTPDRLLSVVTSRTRAVIFNSPSNPSGVTYTPEETRRLAEALAGRDVVVLSDETYDKLVYNDQRVLSFAAAGEGAYRLTLTMNSASKPYAMTGWRVGYVAGDRELISGMARLQSQTTSGAVTFIQHALAEALTGDQSAVEAMRTEFERRADHMYGRLMKMPGVRCPRPTGAFFCFPNVSSGYAKHGVSGSAEFARKLLEEAHVAVVPGKEFGLDSHVRLSFATSMEQIDKGLDRLGRFLA
jgi:aspartate aminotransferase